jgi:hypothetical protein
VLRRWELLLTQLAAFTQVLLTIAYFGHRVDAKPPEGDSLRSVQGGKNWILPKKSNANRSFWDSHWLEIWSNHFCPSMVPNGGSVAMDSVFRDRTSVVRVLDEPYSQLTEYPERPASQGS